MEVLKGRTVTMRPINESDFEVLFGWRNSESYRRNCSTRRGVVSFSEFKEEIKRDLANDRHLQYAIENKGIVVGTIFGYGLNRTDGYIFVTTFIDPTYEKKGFGAEAFGLFLQYLFRSITLYKVYTEVYSYNQHSIECMRKAHLREEGCFVGHRLIDDKRYDLIRYAFFSEQLPALSRKIAYWLKNASNS